VPVLWVLTARTGAGGPAVQETLSVLQRANATFVRLAAITPDAIADMVQDAVRANADESLLTLAAKAHGNPFLVSELVGGLDKRAGSLSVAVGRWSAVGRCRDVWAPVCSSA
jgi:20S proteasome alpha/beta subunit